MSPRTTSSRFKQAAFRSQTGEAVLVLVEIDHPDLAEPIRLSSDGVDTPVGGDIFVACPFAISLPDDRDDQIPRARLQVDNVDRRIVQAVRSIASAPTVKLWVALAPTPQQGVSIEAGPLPFELVNASWDALTVEGELGYELESFGQAYPAHAMTPQHFPGMFS